MLQLNYFKSIKNINRGNISDKTNYIRTKTFYNFYPKKETNKSNDINDNSQSDLNNDSAIKLPKKISTKKPINLLYYKSLPKTRLNIRYNFLLENILKEKEKEFEKDYKFPSDKVLLSKFTQKNNLSRKNKLKKPVLNEYIREITFSTEQKKNIPIPYKHYLTQTKEIYSNLDKTFSFLKNDIKYDLIHDKEKHYKSEEKIKRLLLKKYDEIENMKEAINIKNIPLVDDFIKNKENKNQIMIHNATWNVDGLKHLNEDIAYKHRKFFANKYGIEIKKNMLDVDTNIDDFLVKYQKNLIS